jgi:hypothetical protein
MEKIAEYEQFAEECRALAQSARHPELRAHYLSLAGSWDKMAEERRKLLDQIAKLDRGQPR